MVASREGFETCLGIRKPGPLPQPTITLVLTDSQYAWLHPIIFDFMCKFKASGAGGRAFINNVVQEWMDKRRGEVQDPEKLFEKEEGAPQDFLEKLMIANAKDPEKVTTYNIVSLVQT